jgi:hypothetical protein
MRKAHLAIAILVSGLAAGGMVRAANNFDVVNNGATAYTIGGADNPTLTLTRGQMYTFTVNAIGHPFFVTTARGAATASANQFTTGVVNNGTASGTITFSVPASAPATLFYQCSIHNQMGGTINIVSASIPAGQPMTLIALAIMLGFIGAAILRRSRR